MSSRKHAAGPWLAASGPSSVVGWPVVNGQGRVICTIAWMPRPPDVSEEDWAAFEAECRANAHLVEASPDLLDTCHGLLGLITLVLARDDLPATLRTALESNHRVAAAYKAVAKAEAGS